MSEFADDMTAAAEQYAAQLRERDRLAAIPPKERTAKNGEKFAAHIQQHINQEDN